MKEKGTIRPEIYYAAKKIGDNEWGKGRDVNAKFCNYSSYGLTPERKSSFPAIFWPIYSFRSVRFFF